MVKKRIFGGGGMAQKLSKNGPKMANKVTGVPKKIPKNPQNRKMAKNGPAEPRVIALKCTENALKMSTKGQK